MKLLFQQRIFSWLDSYDIYDEEGNVVFTVKGELSFGHLLRVYDKYGNEVGHIEDVILSFLKTCEIFINGRYVGEISKQIRLFSQEYKMDYNGWQVTGDVFGWDYTVIDATSKLIMETSKELYRFSDTYILNIPDSNNVLMALMVVLAIDIANCR